MYPNISVYLYPCGGEPPTSVYLYPCGGEPPTFLLVQLLQYSFKWRYMAGARAEIMDNGKVESEPKINNFGSTTLVLIQYDFRIGNNYQ